MKKTRTLWELQSGGIYVPTTDKTGRSRHTNITFLEPEQVEATRDAAHQGRHGFRDDALAMLLYDTGLRHSEAAAVDAEMLDLATEYST